MITSFSFQIQCISNKNSDYNRENDQNPCVFRVIIGNLSVPIVFSGYNQEKIKQYINSFES